MSHQDKSARRGAIQVDGCDLAWFEAGAGSPVLFIHGTAARIWGSLFDRISSTHRAIQYDRRGFGDSVHPPIADLSRHAKDAAALLEAMGAASAVVVGWSIGGVIAAELAVRHPSRVRGLVLLEPPMWAKKHPDLNLFNGVVLSIVLGLVAGPARGGRRFSRWVFRQRDGRNSLDSVGPHLQKKIEGNAAAVGTEIRAGTGEHLALAELSAIRLPVTVFSGDRSRRFFAASARRLADAIPNARLLTLPGASHLLQLERPEDIAPAIEAMTG